MTGTKDHKRKQCVIIRGRACGVTAAYELSEMGGDPIVLEQDRMVGGIARTVEHRGYRFDIGGHRFFSKVPITNEWWENMLGDELQLRSRLSRIYYNGAFFDYPLRTINALRGLGVIETLRIVASYVWARTFPTLDEKSFRGMGLQQVWSPVVPDILQNLYRKGMGHEVQRYWS
jgi:protoporphyrinogen oxidase